MPMARRQQQDLFASAPVLPEGMRYVTDVLTPNEEEALLDALPSLPFKEFEFHGFLGKRRVVSFGWHYDFNGGGLRTAGAGQLVAHSPGDRNDGVPVAAGR